MRHPVRGEMLTVPEAARKFYVTTSTHNLYKRISAGETLEQLVFRYGVSEDVRGRLDAAKLLGRQPLHRRTK